MKQNRLIALLLVLALMLCACGGKEAPAPTTAATEPVTEATETTEAPTEAPAETVAQTAEGVDSIVDENTMYFYMLQCMKEDDYDALKDLLDSYVAENNTEMLQAFYNNVNMQITLLMIQSTKVGDMDKLWLLLDEVDAIVNPKEPEEPGAPKEMHSRETAEAFLEILKENMESVKQIIQTSDEDMALITNPTVEDIMEGKLDDYFAVEDSVQYQSLYFMT